MRILDQVRIGDFSRWPTLDHWWASLSDQGLLNLPDAVPVDITNVHDWFEVDWKLDDLAKRQQMFGFCEGMRPSFNSAWFEWRCDEINEKGNHPVKVDTQAIWALSPPDQPTLWTMLVFDRQDRQVLLSHMFCLDLERTNAQTMHFCHPAEEVDEDLERDRNFICTVAAPVILAQALMHCKNVVVNAPTPIPPKLAKKFQQKHGGKPTSFRTVKIEPMKTVMRGAGGVRGIGVEKAMHIVRGNFAEYSEEKPLFGKVVGRIFRPQHVRGNANVGVKEPDYRVQAPKPAKF